MRIRSRRVRRERRVGWPDASRVGFFLRWPRRSGWGQRSRRCWRRCAWARKRTKKWRQRGLLDRHRGWKVSWLLACTEGRCCGTRFPGLIDANGRLGVARNAPAFWMNLQTCYDQEVAEDRIAVKVARDVRPLEGINGVEGSMEKRDSWDRVWKRMFLLL